MEYERKIVGEYEEKILCLAICVVFAGDYITDDIAEDNCEFEFPEDNVFSIDAMELEGKTAAECKTARNEIYARHGRRFNDEQLQGDFDMCSWYEGIIEPENFSDDVLNL